MSNNNLYCLFAYKPASEWRGSWGAYEEYGSHHVFKRNLSFEQLTSELNEIYRIEAQLRTDEEGFTDLTIFEHDPSLEYEADRGQPYFHYYRELTTLEIHNITEPVRLKAIRDVEAERVAEEAADAIKEAEMTKRQKLQQFEQLKKELGL